MSRFSLAAATIVAGLAWIAFAARSGADSEIVAVVGGRVLTGTGAIVDPGMIVIRGGRIESVGPAGPAPAGATIVDAGGAVIIPGLIDAYTTLAQGSLDDDESIASDVEAKDAFDLFGSYRAQLSGGVTTVYVTPGIRRLVSGLGAVAKLAGSDDDRARRLLRPRASMRIALGEAPKNPPGIFEPPIPPSSENPILPVKRQLPTTRMGEIAALRAALNEAREYDAKRRTGGPRDLRKEALARLLRGETPARVNAHKASDILAALRLAEEFGFALEIEGGTEAHLVSADLAAKKIPVVLSGFLRPGQRVSEETPEQAGEGNAVVENAAVLSRAGVKLAIHSTGRASQPDLLLLAGYAVRGGLDRDAALRAVTRDAAEILGVADRVGSIEPGKDGDVVVLTGDPFDARSVVTRVLVEGKTVYRAPEEGGAIAVRAGRVVTGVGADIRGGVVLVEDGKVVEVGEGVSIPPGARIVDVASAVVTPGFIDMGSHLGLSAEVAVPNLPPFLTGEIAGAASGAMRPFLAIVPGDPAFAPAREAGVTSVMLSPGSGGAVSGQATVMKLAGDTLAEMRVREPAAVVFGASAQALGRNRMNHADALRNTLRAGKDYADKWDKYAKDLADWEAKQKAQAAEEKKASDEAKRSATVEPDTKKAEEKKDEKKEDKAGDKDKKTPLDPITGKWEATVTAAVLPEPQPATADLKLSGSTVTGTLTSRTQGTRPIANGNWDGKALTFSIDAPQGKMNVRMDLLEENHLRGEWDFAGMITGQIDARRVEFPTKEGGSGGTAPAKKADGRPEEPRVDDNLEPFRALFKKECVAAVHAVRSDEILNALHVFKDEFALEGFIVQGDEAWRVADEIQKRGWGVAVGPTIVTRDEGELRNNARTLARAGVTVAFQTDSAASTRFLPVNAAYAVRYGLAAGEALRALTSSAAKCLKLDDRIGSLQPGRDADLVVWTGDPFDLGSRIQMVIVSGRVVYEAKP
ncbi:MAG: amidohydrolase family protein [Planctomycetes bacterium]|nr:amidohydrolase family protein [Planctomycetota bacterium]MBI3843075.1 amidohydrolase family protein [Planctomycetota bacterium]